MKKIISTILVGIFLISLASAISIGTFKQGETVRLYQTCNNCTYCNITTASYLRDNSTLIQDVEMSNISGTYFYTDLDGGNTTEKGLGLYNYCYDCGNSVESETGCLEFEVTPSGRSPETSEAIIYIIVLFGSVGLFLLCLYGSLRIPWRHPKSPQGFIKDINYLKHFKIACVFMSYLFLIWIFNILSGITDSFLFLTISYNFFSTIYIILLTGLMVVIPLTAFVIVINLINDKRIKNALNRGIDLS